ncbi:DUF2061 domain-containing protein [uncultured Sulfitobacter sp.]|nr:DUF2061 domain-containing protein [uncultured Sulfitobacter sp.]
MKNGAKMDSKTRLLIKSVTWQIAGLFTMMLIGFVFTGSVAASSGIAFTGAAAGFAAYFLHEMAWSRVSWGKINTGQIND